jgi:Uma2 family endonuclease
MTTTMERQSVVTRADRVPGPEQGHWTYNHYAALPDDGRRYEIVDGVLFNMTPAPGIPHQKVVQRLLKALSFHIEDAELGSVLIAPVDVVLAPNVVVQPDVLVVLNENSDRITEARIVGAPDLVVEVSSPATAGYDRREKQDAYAHAGVPEYWIADPASRTIEVLILEGEAYQSAGVFSGQATLLSKVVPSIAEVRVEQFFV